jgi:hypothetical protein
LTLVYIPICFNKAAEELPYESAYEPKWNRAQIKKVNWWLSVFFTALLAGLLVQAARQTLS